MIEKLQEILLKEGYTKQAWLLITGFLISEGVIRNEEELKLPDSFGKHTFKDFLALWHEVNFSEIPEIFKESVKIKNYATGAEMEVPVGVLYSILCDKGFEIYHPELEQEEENEEWGFDPADFNH